jgi:hypothetical protein
LRAQFISNLGPEWTQSHHSKEGLQVSEKGIEKGARGINKGKKRARGLRLHTVIRNSGIVEKALVKT